MTQPHETPADAGVATDATEPTVAETPTGSEATESAEPPTPAAEPVVPELTFADFNVHPDIVASLADAGIATPSPSRP